MSKFRIIIVSCLSNSTTHCKLAFLTSEYSNSSKKASSTVKSNRCFPSFNPVKGIEYVLSDFNEQQLARKCMEKYHNWKVFLKKG
jgi:hypothetical protein